MGAVNLVKLIELYKEILSSYVTKDDILIVADNMTDKEILDNLVIKNYIINVIEAIEDKYIDKGDLVVIGVKVDELIRTIKLDEDFIKHPCLFRILNTLYNKIIHLKQKG